MILYIFGFIILCIVLFFIYIHLKYKFWALQPVFHFYDVYYWFVNIGIIRKQLPEKNRYVNFKKIKTKCFEEVDELTKKQIVTLIRLNYFMNNENNEAGSPTAFLLHPSIKNSRNHWSDLIKINQIVQSTDKNLQNLFSLIFRT